MKLFRVNLVDFYKLLVEDPDICVPVPYVDQIVDVCVDFYNMVYSSHDVSTFNLRLVTRRFLDV